MAASENLPSVHQYMFENRTDAQSGEKRKCTDNHNHGDEQECEKRGGYRKSTSRFGHHLLARKVSGHRENRNDHEESPEKHVKSAADVVPRRVPVQTGEGRAIVSSLRCIGIENLRQSVRTGIADGRGAERRHNRNAGKAENQKAEDEHRYHGHLYVKGLDLFAEIFRGSADHQASNENRENDENDDAVQTRARSAENDFTNHDVNQRHHTAEGGK